MRHSSYATVAQAFVLRLVTASLCVLFAALSVSIFASIIEFDSTVGAGHQFSAATRLFKTSMVVVIEDGIRIYSVLLISIVHKCRTRDAAFAFAFIFNSFEFIPRAINDIHSSLLTDFSQSLFVFLLIIAYFAKFALNYYITFSECIFFQSGKYSSFFAVLGIHVLYNFGIFYYLGYLRSFSDSHYIPFAYVIAVIIASSIIAILLRLFIIRGRFERG